MRGKRGRRENRDSSGPGGLRSHEVLAQYKAFSELGKGAGFSESMRNPFIPHTQAARAEVNTCDAGSKAGVLRGLCLTGDCAIWWVVLAVDSAHILSAVSYCPGRTRVEALSPLLLSFIFTTLGIA